MVKVDIVLRSLRVVIPSCGPAAAAAVSLLVVCSFYQRYRDVTARIKASSCPSIPPLPHSTLAAIELRKKQPTNATDTNEDVHTRFMLTSLDLRSQKRRRHRTRALVWRDCLIWEVFTLSLRQAPRESLAHLLWLDHALSCELYKSAQPASLIKNMLSQQGDIVIW